MFKPNQKQSNIVFITSDRDMLNLVLYNYMLYGAKETTEK